MRDKEDKINNLSNSLNRLQKQEEAFQESVEAELTHLQTELERHRTLSLNYRKHYRDAEEEIKKLHEHIEAEANESERRNEIMKQNYEHWQHDMNRQRKENEQLLAQRGEFQKKAQEQMALIQNLEEEKKSMFADMQLLKDRQDVLFADSSKVKEDRHWQAKQSQWDQEMNRMRIAHERELERVKMQYSESSKSKGNYLIF